MNLPMKTEDYLKAIKISFTYFDKASVTSKKNSQKFINIMNRLRSIDKDFSISKAEDIVMDSINELVEMTFQIPYEPRLKIQMGLQSLWEIHFRYLKEVGL